jgi:hypothetical protein
MKLENIIGLSFIALSFILYTIERVMITFAWGIHKAGVAANGSGSWDTQPDLSLVHSNIAIWACLLIGIILLFIGKNIREYIVD